MNYSERYIEHFQSPRNVGELQTPDLTVEAEHEGGGCFDKVRLTLRLEGAEVAEAMFKARACSGTIAAMSAATEWAKQRPLASLAEASPGLLNDYLGGVPDSKQHSLELAARCLREAANKQ